MRDKLIELIGNYDGDNDGDFADYLLENGVVVLPCKLGDDLYYNPTPNEIRKSPFSVALIALAEDGWYVSNSFDVDDALYHFDKINTHESYLSKELLEQALKGGVK